MSEDWIDDMQKRVPKEIDALGEWIPVGEGELITCAAKDCVADATMKLIRLEEYFVTDSGSLVEQRAFISMCDYHREDLIAKTIRKPSDE